MILRRLRRGCLFLGLGWCGLTALAVRADEPAPPGLVAVTFRGVGYLVKTVDPKKDDLRLYWKDDEGNRLGDFVTLEKYVESKGERLVFAANAGMFEVGGKPVGLLVQDSNETSPLNLNDGDGNFYLKPNGVFLINEKHEAMVIESSTYPALLTAAVGATQSGPLLVFGGNIHPDFIVDSKSKKWRSGIGVRKDGTVVLALSQQPVNFYDFASLFLDRLNCPNALFLDGDISAFYSPGVVDKMPHTFGPILGLVEKTP